MNFGAVMTLFLLPVFHPMAQVREVAEVVDGGVGAAGDFHFPDEQGHRFPCLVAARLLQQQDA